MKGLVIGGAAAAVAGVAIAVGGGGGGSSGGSRSGGSGGSGGTAPAGGGTCTPGPVTASLSNPTTSLRCGQALTAGIVVSNGSCGEVTVQSIQLTQNANAGPFCSASVSQYSYPPTVTTVAPGQTTTVLSFQSAAFCCVGGPCPGVATCRNDEIFMVLTSAGSLAAGTVPLQVSFDPGCPPCS
jgi:hypothetical protein